MSFNRVCYRRTIIKLPRPTSSNRVCSSRAIITFPTRRLPTFYVVEGKYWMQRPMLFDCVYAVQGCNARPCLQDKSHDGMPLLTLFRRVCCPGEMIAYHSRHRSSVCAVHVRGWHVMPDVVRPPVLPNGDDGIPRPTSSARVVLPKG